MMFQPNEPPAIPLWINGHAYLTMAPAFQDVRNPVTRAVLRRTPMCGHAEALKAVEAAQAALSPWVAQNRDARAGLLAAAGEALSGYTGHFAQLIVEETGMQSKAAAADVSGAIELLVNRAPGGASHDATRSGVVGIIADSGTPLLGPLRLAVPALLAGAVVVIKPNPETPSAIFALAELTAECGFPGGVFSIVHGGDAAVDGLRRIDGVELLVV